MSRDLIDAMVELGWEFCPETRGFRQVLPETRVGNVTIPTWHRWVSFEQAAAALSAAETGAEYRPEPVSETIASITARVANV